MMKPFISFLFLALGMATATAAVGSSPERIDLASAPQWVFSGTWISSSEFALVDVIENSIKVYDLQGQLKHRIGGDTQQIDGYPHEFLPSSIETQEDLFVVESEEAQLLWLDRTGQLRERSNLLNAARFRGGHTLHSAYEWVLYDREVILFGDVKLTDGSWTGAFVHVDLDSRVATILERAELDSITRSMFLVGNSKMSMCGSERACYLTYDFSELQPDGRSLTKPYLDGLPRMKLVEDGQISDFRRISFRPRESTAIGNWQKSDSAVKRFTDLSAGTYVAGIYSDEDSRLALLLRNGASNTWALAFFDEALSKISSLKTLPTRQPHVELVPSAAYWLVIEKQAVEEWGKQRISGALLFEPPKVE